MKITKTKARRHSRAIVAAASGFNFATLRDTSIRAVLGFSAIILVCSWTNRFAAAQENQEHKFRICQGVNFALCSASTCTPTGNKIEVNVPSKGKTRQFPEADCTCPIFFGDAIADLIGGNMQGSCDPPPNGVWSIFSLMFEIPQAINGWVTTGPGALAPPLFCSADLKLGNQQVNCFSFACDTLSTINGVPVATYHCAIGESPAGEKVSPPTAFLSQAGQANESFCGMNPVAGTISLQ